MTAPVTVYSKDQCVQCDQTIKALNRLGIEHEVVDLTTDEAAADAVRAQGFMAAPVVVAGDRSWSGFRPQMIKSLAS